MMKAPATYFRRLEIRLVIYYALKTKYHDIYTDSYLSVRETRLYDKPLAVCSESFTSDRILAISNQFTESVAVPSITKKKMKKMEKK